MDHVAAPNRLQAVSAVGLHFPLHATANGKALLSQLTDTEIGSLLSSKLEKLTTSTVTNIDALFEDIQNIRETGLAYDEKEHHIGISAVGTILDNPYGVSAALSIPVPAERFMRRRHELSKELLVASQRISTVLFSE